MRFRNHIAMFPPILCRILARHRYGKPLTTLELASLTGLSAARVDAFSQCVSWRGVDVHEMLGFAAACGVDFDDRKRMKRIKSYMFGRRLNGKHAPPVYAYLKRSPLWISYYKPLIQTFKNSLKEKIC